LKKLEKFEKIEKFEKLEEFENFEKYKCEIAGGQTRLQEAAAEFIFLPVSSKSCFGRYHFYSMQILQKGIVKQG